MENKTEKVKEVVSPWRVAKPRKPLHEGAIKTTNASLCKSESLLKHTLNSGDACTVKHSPPQGRRLESTRLMERSPVGSPDARSNISDLVSPVQGSTGAKDLGSISQTGSPSLPPKTTTTRSREKSNLSVKTKNKSISKDESNNTSRGQHKTLGGSKTRMDEEFSEESSESEDDQPSGRVQYVGENPQVSFISNKSSTSFIQSNLSVEADASSASAKTGTFLPMLSVLLIGAAAVMGSSMYAESRPKHILYAGPHPLSPTHWNQTRAAFTDDLKQLRKAMPKQTRESWLTISAAIKQTLQPIPEYPAVLLLVVRQPSENTGACLASRLAASAAKALKRPETSGPPTSDNIIQAEAFSRTNTNEIKELLTDRLHKTLSSTATVALLHLDKIHPEVALTLHAFADNSNAPYKQATLILTLSDPSTEPTKYPTMEAGAPTKYPTMEAGAPTKYPTMEARAPTKYPTMEARAEDLLTEIWGESMGQDKLYALISRLAVNVVEVLPEEQVQLAKLCPSISAKSK